MRLFGRGADRRGFLWTLAAASATLGLTLIPLLIPRWFVAPGRGYVRRRPEPFWPEIEQPAGGSLEAAQPAATLSSERPGT